MNWFLEIIQNIFKKQEEENDPRNGLVPSLPDYRDIQASDILGSIDLAPLPETYRIPYNLPIKNQGNTPSCVGQSCATIKDEKERREQIDVDFDGFWIYNEAKKIDGIPEVKGTYFRTGLDILRKVGAKPTPESKIQGLPGDFKIGGYVRVNCDTESIKRAIMQWGCVLAGFYIYPGSWSSAYIKKGTNIVGGHATALVGWNKDYIIGQNSYGPGWGDKGYFYFNNSYLPFECWAVLSDVPTIISEVKKPVYNFKNDLWQGLNNPEVAVLQDCLKFLGCMEKTQESTGVFGNVTKNAVLVFQQRYGIQSNGRVGPITRQKLNELFA